MWDDQVDAVGLLCPLPVLRARKRLMGMAPGQVLRVLANDPMAVVDLPHFCAQSGHDLIGVEDMAAGVTAFVIRRGPDRAVDHAVDQGLDRGPDLSPEPGAA